jgi:hypothetical protein
VKFQLFKFSIASIVGCVLLLFANPGAMALPSQRRLWETKYGYKVSCTLCHSKGGGSQLNGYGEDFQRFGMTPASFQTIESRDSDKDGTSNIAEIQAKSNPGDPNSTPLKQTDWLSKIEDSALPLAELKKIFPGNDKFSALDGTLFPAQIKVVEESLKEKLAETDLVPTFYFAVKDEGAKLVRTGVAIFATPAENPTKLIVGIGVDLSGQITNVVLIKNKLGSQLGQPGFLSQLKGKSLDSLFEVGKDIQPAAPNLAMESKQVAAAVRKGLLIIKTVFAKDSKKSSGANFENDQFSPYKPHSLVRYLSQLGVVDGAGPRR